MSRLSQMQVRYDPAEDRLVLRLNTTDREEFRVWLTRRFVLALWPVLIRMLAAQPEVRRQAGADAKKTVMSFQHEQAVGQTDFDTGFREDAESRPLGDGPLLVSRIRVRELGGGVHALALNPAEGQGLEIALDQKLLHGLCRLLSDGVRRAGWSVELRLPDAVEAGGMPERVN